jgi:hypothetical protein
VEKREDSKETSRRREWMKNALQKMLACEESWRFIYL